MATFYDMFDTVPVGEHQVYVCTNISCSLLGADELYDAMLSAAGDDPRFNVRSFECLGACDIAPMASVDGEYVGPLEPEDCRTIVDDVIDGPPAAGGQAAAQAPQEGRGLTGRRPERPWRSSTRTWTSRASTR